jgi:hypothetical protein
MKDQYPDLVHWKITGIDQWPQSLRIGIIQISRDHLKEEIGITPTSLVIFALLGQRRKMSALKMELIYEHC